MSKNSKKTGLVLLTIFSCSMLFAQSSGETTFKQVCAACHTIAQGKLVGPDLANVHQRRSEDWLIKFIKSSQSVVNSGDSVALQLFNEFNQLIMPDNNLTEEQIKSVIQYIASQSPAGKEAPQTTASAKNSGKSVADASEREIKRGERLFAGKHRLSNGGPTCNSCHHVKNDNIIAGGALAKDLTKAYSRLNEAGIKSVLKSPPFPAMQQAYQNKPLTQQEVFNLTAFLQQADKISASQTDRDYGNTLLFSGMGGTLLVFGLFTGLWFRSKRRSVNQSIYRRQIKSK